MKVDIALIGGGEFDYLRDACCRCSALDVCMLLLLPPPPPAAAAAAAAAASAGDAAACCHAQLVEPEDNTTSNRTEHV